VRLDADDLGLRHPDFVVTCSFEERRLADYCAGRLYPSGGHKRGSAAVAARASATAQKVSATAPKASGGAPKGSAATRVVSTAAAKGPPVPSAIANFKIGKLAEAQRRAMEKRRIQKLVEEQGWALQVVDASSQAVFQELLRVANPDQLGKGRDVSNYGRKYTTFGVVYVWQIVAPERREAFTMQRSALARDCARAERSGHALPIVTSKLTAVAQQLSNPPLEVNEGWYLHGTKPETVLPILSGGLSERMCSGKFGKGVYLAEDPEKADQYTTPDPEYDAASDLHKRLYRAGSATRHPGEDLFYMFLVRAAAGLAMRTRDGRSNMDRPSQHVFASDDHRELSEVPGVSPPLRFHSLVVELGGTLGRFREFVHFNSARFSVEYLIAYRRVS